MIYFNAMCIADGNSGLIFKGDTTNIDMNTIGRSSGLNDKRQDEIYEDDVIEVPYTYEEFVLVKFEDGMFNITMFNLKVCAIIGNIYESPQLLDLIDSHTLRYL